MKRYSFIFFFCSLLSFAQQEVDILTRDSITLKADRFVGIDSFGALYYITNNVLFKKTDKKTYNYNNFQLGKIFSVDLLNPLEITVFYQDFNTVVQLDNTLNEVKKIDFNTIRNFRNVQYARTGIDKQFWIFNLDNHQLELFDYQTEKVQTLNQPIKEDVIAMTSNYNFCWLLTKSKVYQFNFYGSLLTTLPNEGYIEIEQHNGNLLLQKDNELWYWQKNTSQPKKAHIIEKPFLQLHHSDGFVYIYRPNFIEKLPLNSAKKQK
ncbi:hypothetical protein ACFQ1M_11280 [Sungkyunkwania multivorans]|uniref:Uncharacterized protein n=1 Tax=Sungkyunkwania multivorans TaxID=1173618 RepID=A0ABW3D1S4_9FLAO